MVIDKNYFMNRLANGENMDVIGEEIAAMMTEAMNEHKAQVEAAKKAEEAAQAEKEAAKRELIAEMIDLVKELAILEGMDEADMTVTEEDLDQLVAAFTEMFAAMRDLKKMLANIEAKVESDKKISTHPGTAIGRIAPVNKSDEQILSDFIKMFN